MLKYIYYFVGGRMKKEIEGFFAENKIEYFAALDYRDVRETSPEIMARESFSPRSVIVFLVPYFVSYPKNLSVYAASLDYHIFIRDISQRLIALMKELYPDNNFVGYGDHSPIDERHAALIGGLGIAGDSGLFINEKYGSYVFIADLVSDLSPEELSAEKKEIRSCLHCKKCLLACPTGILRGEGTDCLSAITQRKGELSEKEAELMRKCDTVWGCDLCQKVCPYNKTPAVTPIDFFREQRIENLTEEILSTLSKDEFKARAFGWRGRAVVERNLKILSEGKSKINGTY